jgi:hypothetical protein
MIKNIGISGTPEEIQIIAKLLELEGYRNINNENKPNSLMTYNYLQYGIYPQSTDQLCLSDNCKIFKASEFDQAYKYLFDTELFSTEYFTNKKVVIHCTNEEEWKSISELFEIKWYNSDTGWETYKESVCINIDSTQYGNTDFYTQRNYTIIPASFVLKFKNKEMKKFVLPENYIIKQNLSQEVCDYHNLLYGSQAFTNGGYIYLVFDKSKKCYYTDNKNLFPELTLEEFNTHVLKKENNMKKIIGYKAPMDFYGGNVIKGTMYVKPTNGHNWYIPEKIYIECSSSSGQMIPKEIVEQWEAIYEEQEVILSIGKPLQRVIINKNGVTCDNKTMSFRELQALKSSLIPMLFEKVDWNVLVTEIKIGCSKFSIEEFNQVIEASKKFTS